MSEQQQQNNTQGTQQATGGGGDALDKGIAAVLGKTGHSQSNATVEKISDFARQGYQKVTGKELPVKDQEFN